MKWNVAKNVLQLTRPLVMGIVNVTPDSFSDGGRFYDPHSAIDHALKLAADGADILDIGGESTRPHAEPVPIEEELKRILPVISSLTKQLKVPISIDTMKPAVAKAALDCGAVIVNDVSGLRDPEMVNICRNSDCGIVVMHMQGLPQTMQVNPTYKDVVRDTVRYLQTRLAELAEQGIDQARISIDPGIGFGKTLPQTLAQLRQISAYNSSGRPICLGVSRKGFIGQITGRERPNRLAGTLAVNAFAIAMNSAQIIRVHDVAEHRDTVLLWEAIQSS